MKEIIELKKNCKPTDLDIIGDLLQPMDEGKDFISGDNNYVWFYLIGKYFIPKNIVEMGTRFGYSMKAFVKGAAWAERIYSLYSFDLECDGIKTLDIFEDYFKTKLKIKDVWVNRVDTSKIHSLNLKNIDLCLVDGLHTAEGCYHECSMGFEALKKGGVLVVDDVNYDEPKKGAERFCLEKELNYSYLPSLNGIYLIQKL